jgi:hypothetical protein
MKQWLKSDAKAAVHPKTGAIVTGFCNHATELGVKGFDYWVRALVFPSRRRVYFRFYKPDGDYSFIDERDRAKSFDACYTAWEKLVQAGYVAKTWKVLYAETDRVITENDIRY